MALTDKLTAIGDAIRGKTGGSAQLSLTDMATAISGINPTLKGQLYGTYATISARTGYTGQFSVSLGSIDYSLNYRNWILFFPVATAASTYGIGIASNSNILGGGLLWSQTTNTTVWYQKTALLSKTFNENNLNIQGNPNTHPWVTDLTNVTWVASGTTGIYLKNTSNTTYPRAVSGTGWLIYFQPTT